MHKLEPYYRWRDYYVASEDKDSPFFGRQYSEFAFSNKIYNYFIHPQWDEFGSETLYLKILYVSYLKRFAAIELIGEWNDCISNDVMLLKRNVIDKLSGKGICKFALVGENVLNFHSDDDCYYEEWYEDVKDEKGWIAVINFRKHVLEEMENVALNAYLHYGSHFNAINWQTLKPAHFYKILEQLINEEPLRLR